jgi:protein-tyrosine phosphatase
MSKNMYPRQIEFEAVFNFRDLGGYHTLDGHSVAYRRLFRSGNLSNMTPNDLDKLNKEIELVSVLDLRSKFEIEKQGIGLLSGSSIKYFNIPLINDGGDSQANIRRYQGLSNMGEFYFSLIRQIKFGKLLVEALKVIAEPTNHPLVFHCSAGKDRTGVLAAILLSILQVSNTDIGSDFSLSSSYMDTVVNQMKSDAKLAEDAKSLPTYFWESSSDLIESFLVSIRREYGSTREYIGQQGANTQLFDRLERTLLT